MLGFATALPNLRTASASIIQANLPIANGILNPLTFYNYVRNRGPWDLKKQGYSADFGNYHYGIVGAATGLFSPATLLREAGINQCTGPNNNPSQFGNPLDNGSRGDDFVDSHWIREGMRDYYSGMYGSPNFINPVLGSINEAGSMAHAISVYLTCLTCR
ncbi:polymorphic toxin type 44 domain-containing protein [Methyloglobulus sp.]|uniref:polymorphic toxin type 44 domain-containing protein n=1 Tax=Methyloglobulus sp. TaxID=2518622 RepID=UPI0039891EB5